MENAERLAQVLGRQRAEVLARFGYPIGGASASIEQPVAMPPEWSAEVQRAVAAGIADGVAQAMDTLKREGWLSEPDRPDGRSRRRRNA